jgi:hypothetical protein
MIEKESIPSFQTFQFLFILTIIQFWWIAIWGIAYIVIDVVAGPSRLIEIMIYLFMLGCTVLVIHTNPKVIERL